MTTFNDKNLAFDQLKSEWDFCKACPLHANNSPTSINPNGKAHGRGSLQAPIMLVGEAPGESESRTGQTFCPTAPAGRLLAAILKKYGLTDRVFMANGVLCRSLNGAGKNCQPKPEHYEACQPRFQRLIEIVQPRIIVALGSGALRALTLYDGPVLPVVGQIFESPYGAVIASPHPMYYVYSGSKDTVLLEKSRKLWEYVKGVQ